MKTDPK